MYVGCVVFEIKIIFVFRPCILCLYAYLINSTSVMLKVLFFTACPKPG